MVSAMAVNTGAKRTFVLAHQQAKARCLACISAIEPDGRVEVVVRLAKQSKTMRQLGAYYGVWLPYISQETGMTEAEVHKELKANFLSKVFLGGPLNDIQEMWVERYCQLRDAGDWKGMAIHRARLSLGWATMRQTSRYMDMVSSYFISVGKPLPVLEPAYGS